MPRRWYAGAIGFIAGVAFETIYTFSWLLLISVGVFGCVCLFGSALRRNEKGIIVGVFVIAAALGSIRVQFAPQRIPAVFDALINTEIDMRGKIVAPPDVRETSERLTISLQKGGATTRIIAVVSGGTYHVGDIVRVHGTFSAPAPFAGEGGRTFAYEKFLAKDGIFGIIDPARVAVLDHDRSFLFLILRSLQSVHDLFVFAVQRALPQPESALAAGIVIGGKQGLGKALLTDFTASGMLQIVVLSGYNVLIVAEGILCALSFVPRRLAFVLAGGSTLLFIFAAGAGTSALRAGAMVLLALVARATGRTYGVLRALFLALILMLLWNPLWLVYDPGLQLSFFATLGLIAGVPIVTARLVWITNIFVRDLLATTLAAQIAVLPLLLYQSGNLSLVSVPANALAMPVIPAAMAFSAVAAALGILPLIPQFLLSVVSVPAFALLAYVIGIAKTAASLPFSHLILPAFPFWAVLVAYAGLGWVWYRAATSPPRESAAPVRTN